MIYSSSSRGTEPASTRAAPAGRHRQPKPSLAAGSDYIRVTFAEKPDRAVLDALRNAGFSWSRGSWYGYRAKLPAIA